LRPKPIATARAASAGLGLACLVAGAIGPADAGTLDVVRARGRLACGVSDGLRGFAESDATGRRRGFDIDFCKAVAAAALGDADKVDYVPLPTLDRFQSLIGRRIDLLARSSAWNMSRDIGLPLEFVGVSYYDGQGLMIPALYGANSPLQLGGATFCGLTGSTSETNVLSYYAKAGLEATYVPFVERAAARAAYAEGKCDVYTADRSALAAERSLLPNPDDHVILNDVISKEPLGPVTRDDDPAWTNLVRWTLFALINAEEAGLDAPSMATPADREEAMRFGEAAAALDLAPDWVVKVIAAVGSYREIFERNLGSETPLELSRGLNALWSEGGLLYAPPMQ
jgi:general L-amino acid transport system substrate-binding protein